MSRIGRKPIVVPAGVTVTVDSGRIKAIGPKGTLERIFLPGFNLMPIEGGFQLERADDNPVTLPQYGLMRSLINNMVVGVSEGYQRQLEINGVGYRASVAGSTVNLSLGFSHPVAYALPAGVSAKVEKNIVTIMGHDKQAVGQVAANLRALKKPEPYKGKGIKYIEERIRRKAGKTATKG